MRVLVLAIAASFLSGCFVLDELDQGEAIMDAHRPAAVKEAEKAKEREKARANAKGSRRGGAAAPPPSHEWWAKARTLSRSSQDAGDPDRMVRCTTGRSSSFTRRSDCLARGGTPSAP